jgi:hypothetical protein
MFSENKVNNKQKKIVVIEKIQFQHKKMNFLKKMKVLLNTVETEIKMNYRY